MRSSQNMAIVKIHFRSRDMAFSNNHLLFVPMGKGICDWQRWHSIGNSGTGDPSTLHHEQTIFGEVIHTHTDYIKFYGKRYGF